MRERNRYSATSGGVLVSTRRGTGGVERVGILSLRRIVFLNGRVARFLRYELSSIGRFWISPAIGGFSIFKLLNVKERERKAQADRCVFVSRQR